MESSLYSDRGLCILSLGLNCTMGVMLQFYSWVVLFSLSLLFVLHLLSQDPFVMLTITISLSVTQVYDVVNSNMVREGHIFGLSTAINTLCDIYQTCRGDVILRVHNSHTGSHSEHHHCLHHEFLCFPVLSYINHTHFTACYMSPSLYDPL